MTITTTGVTPASMGGSGGASYLWHKVTFGTSGADVAASATGVAAWRSPRVSSRSSSIFRAPVAPAQAA